MQKIKRQYEKPEITDQGSVVDKTRARQVGQCWDGSPNSDDDQMYCPPDY